MKYSEGVVSAQCASISGGRGWVGEGGCLGCNLTGHNVKLQEQQRQGGPCWRPQPPLVFTMANHVPDGLFTVLPD